MQTTQPSQFSIAVSPGPSKTCRYKLNCVGVSQQEGPWSNGKLSGLSHQRSGLKKNFFNAAAATPTSSKMCNLNGVLSGYFLGATKQAISIKLATTVGHCYEALTLQMLIWLAHLVTSFTPPLLSHC